MNYNFTDHVRTALAQAREEARGLSHDYIGTEHILLGLLRDDGIIGQLRAMECTPEEIRRAVEASVRRGRTRVESSNLPYTARAKKVLELAMKAARDRRDSEIRTEHLLMGVLLEEKGIGAEVLRQFGITGTGTTFLRSAPPSGPRGGFRVRIDDAADRSIYEQIVAQITEAAATGDLRPGERLPTVRQLADELDVAPGTVARAYGELERERLVVTEGARGTRVAERSAPPARELERPETLTGLLRPVAVAAFHLGASAAELRAALEEAMRGIFDKQDHAA